MRIKFLVFSLAYTRYRGNWNRYHPLISYWKVNFRSSDFHISYWEKISENLPDLQRGTLYKKQFGPVTILKSGDEIFRIVTGSKLAANQSLNGGYLFQIARYPKFCRGEESYTPNPGRQNPGTSLKKEASD